MSASIFMAIDVTPIPALRDNYIWLLSQKDNNQVCCVDPGEAKPVLTYLEQHQLQLNAILITHHHWDHTNGLTELCEHFPATVYGPRHDPIQVAHTPLSENDSIHLDFLNINLSILDIPAHTLGHIAYLGDGCLFSGDTLFTAGCGRVFEGTYEQMFISLNKLAHLPNDTRVYCGHEYTENNLRFALAVEPENPDIQCRYDETLAIRQQGLPTVPATLAEEQKTNPFLRCHLDVVKKAAEAHCGQNLSDPIEIFRVIREWKNQFN